MPSHHDSSSLTTYPQAGAGLGGRGPWLGGHSKIRVLAQVCRATPVSKILSSVYSRGVGWPGLWAFYSRLPPPTPGPPPVLRSSTALKDSFLSCLLQGMVNTLPGPVQGAFLLGVPVPSQQAWFGMHWGSVPRYLVDQETGCRGQDSMAPSSEFGQERNWGCDWAWTGDRSVLKASEPRRWYCPVPQDSGQSDEQQRGPQGPHLSGREGEV